MTTATQATIKNNKQNNKVTLPAVVLTIITTQLPSKGVIAALRAIQLMMIATIPTLKEEAGTRLFVGACYLSICHHLTTLLHYYTQVK